MLQIVLYIAILRIRGYCPLPLEGARIPIYTVVVL